MRLLLALVAALTLLPACAASPPPSALPSRESPDPRALAVDRLFARWARPDSPGCAVAVSEDGRVLHARGYGMADLEHGIALSPGTSFHVASVSKQFTALAVLMLAHEGRLSLDDDVRRHVPEVPAFGGARITLRHLLHHTSGLRDQWSLLRLAGFRPEDVITDADVLDIVSRQQELNFAPGEEHLYSNTGYGLLAIVVQRLTGKPLNDFASARIFGPLGLSGTHFHADHTSLVPGRSYGYERRGGDGYRLRNPPFDTVGASSLHSTPLDLVRWSDALADGRAAGPAVTALMIAPGRLADGTVLPYAAGLQIGSYRGLPTVEHGGADAGFRAEILRFPAQRLAIACTCNIAEARPQELAHSIADIYLEGRLAPRPEAPSMAADPARAGTYYNPRREEILRVEHRDNQLSITGVPLAPLAEGRFRLGTTEIAFRANGPRVTLERTPQGLPTVGYERVDPPHPTAADLAPIAGVYESPELDARYTLTVTGDTLSVRPPRTPARRLAPVSPDVFADDDGRVIHIVRAADNHVTGFTLSTGRVRRLRFVRRSG
ncbi:MAG: serine hydrolase domain-containing protein [Minicystis sp.]